MYGRAVEILELETRRRNSEVLYEKIGVKPEEPEYHLFSIAIDSAAFAIIQDEEWRRKFWQAGVGTS